MAQSDLEAQYDALHRSVVRLTDLRESLFEIRGPDAGEWLQGQITQDLRKLKGQGALEFCLVKATGQIETTGILFAIQDGFGVAIPTIHESILVDRLERFVVMEDIEWRINPDLVHISLQGPKAQQASERIEANYSYPKSRSVPGGYDLWGQGFLLDGLEASADLAELARLEAGVPDHGKEILERTLPQELGEAFIERCVSFEKGCYVGQEVLMRIHSRGQVHRRLHRFESPLPISPGDPLCGLDGVPLAEATSAIRRLDDLWIGLTFLRNETSTGELPPGLSLTPC